MNLSAIEKHKKYSRIKNMLLLLQCLLIGFTGYAIGRIGHIYWGHLKGPDHWIYGVLLFLPGLFFINQSIFFLFSFGAGLIISDLKDFFNLKLYGEDNVEIKKFLGVD